MARTVLVVDDEPTLRAALAEALEQDGLKVVTAADGREALERFRATDPDLMLLDLMLPQVSGIEVCRIVRRESSLPIIMLTAKDGEIDKVVGLELGADDYVTKPFSLRELMARIRTQLRRLDAAEASTAQMEPDGASGPAPVHLDGVTIDVVGHRVVRDGVDLPVKPKAFELLVFLLQNPGQVFSRAQLLDQVWGYGHEGYEHTVNSHINRLRTKIETNPQDPRLIETVWGIGYRFGGGSQGGR